jgi:hypothetical protein
MAVTYHVSVFDRGADGALISSLAGKADSAEQAISRAQALSREHVGVVAFARSERGNSLLAEFGKVLRDELRAGPGYFAGGLPRSDSCAANRMAGGVSEPHAG